MTKHTLFLLPLLALVACGPSEKPGNADSSGTANEVTPEMRLELARIRAEAVHGDVSDFGDGLARVIRYDSVGYIDTSGKIIIPKKYKAGTLFREGLCGVADFNDHVTYFDKNGNVAFECPDATFPYEFNGGYAVFMAKNEMFGLMDKTGKIIHKPVYNQTSFNKGELFIVDSADNHWGILNAAGKWAVRPIYRSMSEPDEQGYIQVRLFDGNYGYIDATGKELIPAKYYNLFYFSNDLAPFIDKQDEGKYGAVNRKGEVVIQPKYEAMEAFSEGLACVSITINENESKTGFIDVTGKEVIPLKPGSFVSSFHNGLAQFIENEKIGFMDKTGKTVLPAIYDDAEEFEHGFALVKVKGEEYYINTAGKRVTN
jgi:hypothetical protein